VVYYTKLALRERCGAHTLIPLMHLFMIQALYEHDLLRVSEEGRRCRPLLAITITGSTTAETRRQRKALMPLTAVCLTNI